MKKVVVIVLFCLLLSLLGCTGSSATNGGSGISIKRIEQCTFDEFLQKYKRADMGDFENMVSDFLTDWFAITDAQYIGSREQLLSFLKSWKENDDGEDSGYLRDYEIETILFNCPVRFSCFVTTSVFDDGTESSEDSHYLFLGSLWFSSPDPNETVQFFQCSLDEMFKRFDDAEEIEVDYENVSEAEFRRQLARLSEGTGSFTFDISWANYHSIYYDSFYNKWSQEYSYQYCYIS